MLPLGGAVAKQRKHFPTASIAIKKPALLSLWAVLAKQENPRCGFIWKLPLHAGNFTASRKSHRRDSPISSVCGGVDRKQFRTHYFIEARGLSH